ncbi:condensin complex subunit 1 [Trichonephila inaurata madagascariensis]|uniref:Condensin complex subunit 1 n=1 Tax=Trichonephila inaurata madagascariensis TaxID=2747483 RepID=A0A8X6XIZ2_9ARAC|nr:condensin complex subunit 1 [Trichonephila inaurata madagascariensis]
MCDIEFIIPSRFENLFSSTSRHYTVKEVLSKQSITVEVLSLKRSMYEDGETFIFKHFDLYCNLIRQFPEFDEGLKISAFRVLLQVSKKVIQTLTDTLEEETEEYDTQLSSKCRNMILMSVYLLCQFTHAFEEEIIKKTANANIGKGRKKKMTVEESELSEWPEERLKFFVTLKKIFQLPIRKFWNPPIIDYEFINYVTTSFFKLLENTEISKDKGLRIEIFRFLGSVLAENRTGIGYSIKILQMVQDFEHLPNIMADAVVYFMQENSADTLAADICREAVLLDIKALVNNLTAAHSLSQFLVSISERCPEKVLCVIGNLLQFLEMESHVMRNCVLSIIGIILSKVLANENISSKDKKLREELLSDLEAHLLDNNSFVRSKTIQIFKALMDEKALTSVELYRIGKLISNRIKDKASNVRKNAMSFMALFIDVNQFACQIPLDVLKESYQTEYKKLKQLEKSRPLIFEDSDDEEIPDENKANCIIFDDSDEEDSSKCQEKEKADGEEKLGDKNESNMQIEEKELPVSDEPKTAEVDNAEEFAKQKAVVDYLKNTLNFAEVIHGIIEPVSTLLHSSTQTDVLEAIDFFTSAAGSLVTGSDAGIRQVLELVWSNEVPVKEAVLNAFKSLYLTNVKDKRAVPDIAKNLINLLKNSSQDDELNLQAFVSHFCKLGEIPESISGVLWANLINPASGVTDEEKIAILMLLGMIAEQCPEFVWQHLNALVEYGLGSENENNFQISLYMLRVLSNANLKNRGKYLSANAVDKEMRLPNDHIIAEKIKILLTECIKSLEDNQWTPMANEAVNTIFCLMNEPEILCMKIVKKVTELINEELVSNNEDDSTYEVSNILLSRFMSLCGHIALHYLTYLKVDYFAHLRREEIHREQRRRKSTMNMTFTTPKYTSMRNSPTSKTKKRQSISKSYKLVPPIDEETTYEQILDMCAKDVKDETKLIGSLLPIVVAVCRASLKEFNQEVQAAASVALTKFMLFSEKVCEENMQLFATITEKSPEPYIRANMVIAMGDLSTSYPNIVEPWTPQIYQRLSDSVASVREAAIITLTHLILHDFVRVKSLVSEAAKCIADEEKRVSDVAKYLFTELSKKGNIIYNIIPDIISTLSDPKAEFSEEKFQIVLRHMLQYIEKEKLVEGLVEKLCVRFTGLSSDVQLHELTFCLSILTLNDKCYSKLMEFKNLLKERMSDPIIMKYITNITANAKKNDAKTAAELEMFRKELGI